MMLISNNSSWTLLQNIFNEFYQQEVNLDYINLKQFLFNTQYEIDIIYMDTLVRNGQIAGLNRFARQSNFCIVLNDTVTDLPYYSLCDFKETSNHIIVFKHTGNNIQNICLYSQSASFSMSGFFSRFQKIIVPIGTSSDYIEQFKTMWPNSWQESYRAKLYEGDEFNYTPIPEEEVSENET